jgi:hypothetical protein
VRDADKIFDEIIGAQKVRNPELRALIEERMKAGGEVHAANGLPLTFAQDKEDPDALQNWMRERQFGKVDIPAPYKVKPEEVTVARAMKAAPAAPVDEVTQGEYGPRERLRELLQKGLGKGMSKSGAIRSADILTGAASFVAPPMWGYEGGQSLGRAYDAAKQGDYGTAAIEGGLGTLNLLPALPGAKVLAKATEGMPAGLAIKPVGGQWLSGNRGPKSVGEFRVRDDAISPEGVQSRRDIADASRQNYEAAPTETNRRLMETSRAVLEGAERRAAVNNWIDSNLQNYLRKQMGTPDDPVLKLAEEGVLHMPQRDVPLMSDVARAREIAGFPALGTATTDLGRMWENLTDAQIASINAGTLRDPKAMREIFDQRMAMDQNLRGNRVPGQPETLEEKSRAWDWGSAPAIVQSIQEKNPWLEKLNPDEMVYRMRNRGDLGETLGVDHIIDVLREDMATGRLRPEQLSKMSMEQAVRRTAEYDAERAAAMAKADEVAAVNLTPHRDYQNGFRMVQLDKPGQFAKESDRMGHSVRGYEPSKGHEDWSEASGNSGHSTYGHGGWEAIKSGDAQVLSFRDSKNRPHATLEIKKPRPTYQEMKKIIDGYDMDENAKMDRLFQLGYVDKAGNILPDKPNEIFQIKGKVNNLVNEDYWPYLQRYVRESGMPVWPDDLDKIGLIDMRGIKLAYTSNLDKVKNIPDYITESEKQRLRSTGQFTPDPHFSSPEFAPKKMKRGGEVHMAGGGDVAKALAKALKASEALGGHEGKRLFTTQSDRTKVGGKYLGGPGFSSLQLTNPLYEQANAVWGVGEKSAASKMINAAKGSQEPSVWTTMLGSPEQHRSNQQVFDELLKGFRSSAKKGNLDPDLHARINAKLAAPPAKDAAPVFEEGVDILDPKFRQIADTFDKRAHAASVMSGEGLGGKKGQIIDYEKILRGSTDPMLTDVPTFSMGPRLFELHGDVVHRPDLHPAFPVILTGKDFGTTFDPVPRDLMLRDFVENMIQTKGRKPGYMDLIRNTPSQFLSEDFLTGLQKSGYKQGGTVTKSVKKRSKNG